MLVLFKTIDEPNLKIIPKLDQDDDLNLLEKKNDEIEKISMPGWGGALSSGLDIIQRK